VPVIFRPTPGAQPGLMVRLPYSSDNRAWLRGTRRMRPTWIPAQKYWRVPRAWFSAVLLEAVQRYGGVYVIEPHNELEQCARACWEARGDECQCSCLGIRHGEGRPGGRWYEVSDACAVRWKGGEMRWRLVTRRFRRER